MQSQPCPKTTIALDPLLTSAQVAEALGINEGTLQNWRVSGRYPLPYVKIGDRCVRYRRSDVQAFIEASVKSDPEVCNGATAGGSR